MRLYGRTAVKAAELCRKDKVSPVEAWDKAAMEVFPHSVTSRTKGCPKHTFLALCQEGLINEIGEGFYTRSQKNKDYAVKAVEKIKEDRHLIYDFKKLWHEVSENKVSHNSQMDVVVALYLEDFLDFSHHEE